MNLTKVDYVTVGVTSHGTTRILPVYDPKHTQKFVVGDHDGIIHIYGMKKGELQLIFKSLPGPPIKKVILGSSLGTPKDKIFVARENTVQGYTRKGKLFLEFDTNLIEPIAAMYVLGPDLAACARDVYHRYQDCRDADSYLAGEKLLDVILLPGKESSVNAVLACSDCAIRLLQGVKGPIVLRLPSIPTVLSLCREGDQDSMDRLLVGTIDGKIGLLIVDGRKNLRVTWLLKSPGSEITCLDTYELQEGLDLLVGRQDGFVEVYAFSAEDDTMLTLRYRHNAGESISTVIGGKIGSAEYPEILVTTYSGQVFGLTTKPRGLVQMSLGHDALMKAKMEIMQLEQKLAETSRMMEPDANLTPLILAVDHRMVFDSTNSLYMLSIELDSPIDFILLQSNIPVELLDVESSNAVVSLSECDPRDGNYILATYRCQVNISRQDMKIRTTEGQSGVLKVYVTSQIPPKCCRRIFIPICALSLHIRLHGKEDDARDGPFNELKLSGHFTVAEMHAWLGLILLDVPERPYIVNGESEAALCYSSSLIGSLLKCKYKKGSAIFLSENISAIMILRNVLTKEATMRKIKLDVSCEVAEGSIVKVLELIFPRFKSTQELNEKMQIIDALQEWGLTENPHENLGSTFQELLNNEQVMRTQMRNEGEISLRLHDILMNLYVDWKRAKGMSRVTIKDADEILKPILEALDFQSLVQAFLGRDSANPGPSTSQDDNKTPVIF